MSKLFLNILFLAAIVTSVRADLPFQPRIGDFIVQSLSGSFASGVSGATNSPWSHVGIVDSSGSEYVVIEANFGGVVATPLLSYLQRCKHKYAVIRMNLDSETMLKIVKRSRSHLGKPYDHVFRLNEVDTLYCSELIYDALKWVLLDQNPLSPSPMDFSGALEYWQKYFNRYAVPIPQGDPGVSPHDIFKISGATIIYRFKNLRMRFKHLYGLN